MPVQVSQPTAYSQCRKRWSGAAGRVNIRWMIDEVRSGLLKQCRRELLCLWAGGKSCDPNSLNLVRLKGEEGGHFKNKSHYFNIFTLNSNLVQCFVCFGVVHPFANHSLPALTALLLHLHRETQTPADIGGWSLTCSSNLFWTVMPWVGLHFLLGDSDYLSAAVSSSAMHQCHSSQSRWGLFCYYETGHPLELKCF